ncbi:MAG: biotin/lipoyl-binding protein [Duodenibacillus massiliensis]
MIGGVILLIFAWLFFPWNAQVTALAVLRAYGETIFYATTPAVIKAVHARAGLSVRQGDVLYELTSPKLENEARKLTADLAADDWRINFLRVNRETAAEAPLAERERAEIAKRLTEVKRQLAALTVTSPFDGVIWKPNRILHLGNGCAPAKNLRLLRQ